MFNYIQHCLGVPSSSLNILMVIIIAATTLASISYGTTASIKLLLINIPSSILACYAGIPLGHVIYHYIYQNAVISIICANIAILIFIFYIIKVLMPYFLSTKLISSHVYLNSVYFEVIFGILNGLIIVICILTTLIIAGQDIIPVSRSCKSRINIIDVSRNIALSVVNVHIINKIAIQFSKKKTSSDRDIEEILEDI